MPEGVYRFPIGLEHEMHYDDPRNYEPTERVCRTCEHWIPAFDERNSRDGLCSLCKFSWDWIPWSCCDDTCDDWQEC